MTSCRSQWNEMKGGYNDVINELISVTDQKDANEEWRNENMVSIDLERVSCRFELFSHLLWLCRLWRSPSHECDLWFDFPSQSLVVGKLFRLSLQTDFSLSLSLSLSLPRFSISSVKHGEVHWRDMLIRKISRLDIVHPNYPK